MEKLPLAKLKILSCYHEIKKILNDEIPVPRCIKIFPSEVCNHKCKGCHSIILHNKKFPFLDLKLYKRLVDEWAELGVQGINFGGGGEPLMHPNIQEMIEYAGKKGIAIGMLTNGTLLKNGVIDPILKYNVFIRIGIDAATHRIYKKQHGVDQFNLLINNIKKIVERRKELKSKTTIGLKFLVTKINYKDISQVCKLASELGVDYIHFKAVRQTPYEITEDMNSEINEVIKKCKEKYKRDDFNIFGDVEKTRAKVRCFLNMLKVVLNTDGNLYICPAFQHRIESHKIGNINEKKFSEVWFSKEHLEKVKNIKISECQFYDCPMHQAYDVVKEAVIDNRFHLQFM